jgi:tetratricopeptide (TPR) repeat protein
MKRLLLADSKRSISIVILILICLNSFSQLPNNFQKAYYKQIKKAYKAENYGLTDSLCVYTLNQGFPLNKNPFEYWLDATYQLKSLLKANKCYSYFESQYKNTIYEKLINKDYLAKLKRLSEIQFLMSTIWDKNGNLLKDEKVIGILNRVIDLEPDFYEPHQYLAYGYLFYENYEKAIIHAEKSLELKPDLYYTYTILADANLKLKNYEKTLEILEKISEIQEPNSWFYDTKSTCEYETGDYENCLSSIKKAIELNPNIPRYYNNLETIYFRTKQFDKMLSPMLKTLELEEIDFEKLQYIHFISITSQKEDSVLNIINNKIKTGGDNDKYILFRTLYYSPQDENDFDAAMNDYNRLIMSDPENALYYYLKGEFVFNVYTSDKEIRSIGKKALEKAIIYDPNNFKAYEYLCRFNLFSDAKRAKEVKHIAIENLRRKAYETPDSAENYYILALAFDLPINGYGYEKLYNDSIVKYLNLAINLGHDSVKTLQKRAETFEDMKKYEEAISDYLWLYEKTDSDYLKSHILYKLSDCFKLNKEYEKAREYIIKVKELYPQHFNKWRLIDIENKLNKTK